MKVKFYSASLRDLIEARFRNRDPLPIAWRRYLIHGCSNPFCGLNSDALLGTNLLSMTCSSTINRSISIRTPRISRDHEAGCRWSPDRISRDCLAAIYWLIDYLFHEGYFRYLLEFARVTFRQQIVRVERISLGVAPDEPLVSSCLMIRIG
jgi:hypothetical protein